MKNVFDRPIIFILLLVALGGFLFFFRLNSPALTDPDETFYAQTAKEMLHKGEWITPYLYGKPQFEKPAFFYWLVKVSYKVFGVNEFAARFPSAVFGLIGVILMYLLGSLLFGRRAGAFAAVIFASNVEYVILARACVTDMVLTVFMLLGAYRFFCGYITGKRFYYVLSGLAFGLAVLTKGPVFAVLAIGVFLGFLIFAKDLASVRKMPVVWMILAYLAVTVPWYLAVYKLHGNTFITEFFGFQNVTRFMASEHKIGSQVYYNIPIIMGGFFPWSVFLPFGLWHMFKKARSKDPALAREKKGSIFTLIWFFVIFLFFTASSTKLPTYIFPSFIALALIVGVLWDDFLKAGSDIIIKRGLGISYYVLMATVAVGSLVAIIFLYFDYPSVLDGVTLICLFVIFGMALSLAAFKRRYFLLSFFLIVYAVGILLFPMDLLVLPEIERYETSKEVSAKLMTYMRDGEELGAEGNYRPGLAFYTGRFAVDVDKHHNLVALLGSPKRVWCVLKEKNHRFLYELDTKPIYTKPSYMVYKIGKRSIITNMLPEDGKYIIKRERVD